MLEIKETTIEDIKCVQQLWADGDVMKFVGFPDGLHETDERMQNWLRWIESNRPTLNHYSIFEDGKYCGESFYEIDAEHQSAALDIKLFGFLKKMDRMRVVILPSLRSISNRSLLAETKAISIPEKKAEKAKEITEDESKKGVDDVQKLTDKIIKEIDAVAANKEKEVMEI